MDEKELFDFDLIPGRNLNNELSINSGKPLISVVSSCLEKNNVNIETAYSVINQTFPYWEWNIIKNKELNIDSIEKIDDRIHIYEDDDLEYKNIIKYANCDLILFLDFNNQLDKTYMECAYFSLLTNSEASMVYSNRVLFDENELDNSIINKEKKISTFLFNKNKDSFSIKMNYYGNWVKKDKIEISNNFQSNNGNVGINYPVGTYYDFTEKPYCFEWDRKPIKDKSKKNILFIVPWFKVGGADKFNYELMSRMNPDEYDITIITTEPSEYIWRQKFEKMATVFDLSSFLHRENWAAFIDYIIKSRNIDLVMNSNSYYGFYALPWLKSQNPEVIFTDYLHALNYDWRNGEYPPDSVAISRILDKSFVSCKLIKDVMKNEMGRKTENVKVSYIGVDEERFNEDNKEIEIDEELKQYEDKNVILFCARISEEKQPLKMIDIFKEYLKKDSNAILFVVGDGILLDDMKQKANDLGLSDKVVFFGNQEDVRKYYKLAKALVICSKREGVTLTSYEALSMGVPVISSDVGAQKELIDDTCGKIIENIDNYEKHNEMFVEEMYKIINSKKYKELKENARNKIVKDYSLNKNINEIINEFDKLIKQGTQVKKEYIENEELYSRYLVLYNELDRRTFNQPVGGEEHNYICSNQDIIEQEIERYKEKVVNPILQELEETKQELEAIKNGKAYIYSLKIKKAIKKIKGKK